MLKAATYIAFIVTTLSYGQAANGQLSQDQKDFILMTHNQFRSQVFPGASNMLEMAWNEELANIAQKYSQQCVFKISNAQSENFLFVGENIARIGPLTSWGEKELRRLLDDWNNERHDYNLSTNTCSDMCDHYTQLVWASTNNVGCGITLCPILNTQESPVYNSLNFVCIYGPAVYKDIELTPPYVQGTPCSACPADTLCSENLCFVREPDFYVDSNTTEEEMNTTMAGTSDPSTSAPATTVSVTTNPSTSPPVTTVPVTSAPSTSGPVTTVFVAAAPSTSGPVTMVFVAAAPITPSPADASRIRAINGLIRLILLRRYRNPRIKFRLINSLIQKRNRISSG